MIVIMYIHMFQKNQTLVLNVIENQNLESHNKT